MSNRELFNVIAYALNDVNAAYTKRVGGRESGVVDVVAYDPSTGKGAVRVEVYERWSAAGFTTIAPFRITYNRRGEATLRFRGCTRRVFRLDRTAD